MKSLIVDDEPLARRELRRLLAEFPWIEIVGEATASGEYRGWRPDRTVGLAAGVGGLLGGSAVYWWVRRRKATA